MMRCVPHLWGIFYILIGNLYWVFSPLVFLFSSLFLFPFSCLLYPFLFHFVTADVISALLLWVNFSKMRDRDKYGGDTTEPKILLISWSLNLNHQVHVHVKIGTLFSWAVLWFLSLVLCKIFEMVLFFSLFWF